MRRITLDGENADEYDMAAAIRRCKEQRLRQEKAQERLRRISKMDHSKDNTRVAMIPIDSQAVGIPRDLRRVASYTTLYVLGSGSRQRERSRWGRIRLALQWMVAYWRSQKLGMTISEAKLNTKEIELISPYANLIKVSRQIFINQSEKSCYRELTNLVVYNSRL